MSAPTSHQGPVPEFALPRLPSGKIDVAAWTKQLGVAPIHDIRELAVGVWPEEDSVDDFLAARKAWRAEGQS